MFKDSRRMRCAITFSNPNIDTSGKVSIIHFCFSLVYRLFSVILYRYYSFEQLLNPISENLLSSDQNSCTRPISFSCFWSYLTNVVWKDAFFYFSLVNFILKKKKSMFLLLSYTYKKCFSNKFSIPFILFFSSFF